MKTRNILALSCLCLTLFLTAPAMASNPASKMLLALGQEFSAMRVPLMNSRQELLNADQFSPMKNRCLISSDVQIEKYNSEYLLDFTVHLMLISLPSDPLSIENMTLLTTISDKLQRENRRYQQNMTIAYNAYQQVQGRSAEPLISFLEAHRYGYRNKLVILTEQNPSLKWGPASPFATFLQNIRMPGIVLATELDAQKQISITNAEGQLLPLVSAYRNGRLMMGGPFTHPTTTRPGTAIFIPDYLSELFAGAPLPSSLPILEHILSEQDDRDQLDKTIKHMTYKKSEFWTDPTSRYVKGFIIADLMLLTDDGSKQYENIWCVKTRQHDCTFRVSYYPRYRDDDLVSSKI